jgi:hypothetical protein
MVRAALLFSVLFAGCQTPTRQSAVPAEGPLGSARLKPRMAKVLVDSPTPPLWMAQGGGCSVGTVTAEVDGRSDIVQAHVCVGIAPANCEAAEQSAHKALNGKFAGLNQGMSGVILKATWRGPFNGQDVCAAQVAWSFSEEQKLTQRWQDLADRGAALVTEAKGSPTSRCDRLHNAKTLLDQVPDHVAVKGGLAPRVAGIRAQLDELTERYCWSEKALAIGVGCRIEEETVKCPMEAAAAVAKAATSAGYSVVGTPLGPTEVEAVLEGDKKLLQGTAKRAKAASVLVVLLQSTAYPDTGRSLKLCRGRFVFRQVDSRSGSASTTGKGAGKGGGITLQQCHQKAFKVALMRAKKSLASALKNP